MRRSETGTAEGHVFFVPGELFRWRAHNGRPKAFEVVTMVRRLSADGALCHSPSARRPVSPLS